MTKIIIKSAKVAAIQRKHPWIFSGAIQKIVGKVKDGDIVTVYTPDNQYLATGHYQDKGSISVRIFSFDNQEIDASFWEAKIQKAVDYRERIGLFSKTSTNVFRLINAEGDGLPSLIADFYNGVLVIQTHSMGMYKVRKALARAFTKVLGDRIEAIYDKSKATLPNQNTPIDNAYLYGNPTTHNRAVTENGHQFLVDWAEGQKTGFFIDQRDNRQLLGELVKGKKVLNAFCYSGGFSVYALKNGASLVHSVDSSRKAMDWTVKNIALNDLDEAPHEGYTKDVFKFLQATEESYDVIVLDPPAYTKNLKRRHKAIQGYKRLNAKALSVLPKGGLLMTYSCSGVVTRQLFVDTIRAAAIEAGREVKLIKHLVQPYDHPVNIFHPEGEYLKGVLLEVQ